MIDSAQYLKDIEMISANIPEIQKLKQTKILVTGVTGMICSAVVDTLLFLNQSQNLGIDLTLAGRSKDRVEKRFKPFKVGRDFHYVHFDVTRPVKINNTFNFIIHGASNANPTMYLKEPVETLVGNIIGTDSILQLAARSVSSRVLYISSSEVYGNELSTLPREETDYGYIDPLNPRSAYPNGKRAAETLCVAYGLEHGVDSVIVRPGHIYGPTITKNDTRATAQFTRDALAHRSIIMKSQGTQIRSYCYVLDCASAILTVLLVGHKGEAYNISNRNSIVSIREIAECFAKFGKTELKFENATDAEKRSYNLMDNSSLNARKLEMLGWRGRFSLSDGVSRTLTQLKAEMKSDSEEKQ
jgi:nucleoside-diphosphate-sugar epimerase